MLCECQKKYLEYLKDREKRISRAFSSPDCPELPLQSDFELTCERPCEKVKKLVSVHLQVETEVVCRLGDRKLDPQHFQLLCERLVSVATL